MWYFDCNQWLDAHLGDCATQRLLKASLEDPRSQQTNYLVTVHTSDKAGAGTDANVFVILHGEAGTSGRLELSAKAASAAAAARGGGGPGPNRNLFERNQADVFMLAGVRELGDLRKLHIGHDGAVRACT